VAPINGGVDTLLDAAQALKAAAIAVDDVSLRQPTLDEVFLTLTGAPPEDETEEEQR
jgi:ABC-2 type transport system ATP-binding protein